MISPHFCYFVIIKYDSFVWVYPHNQYEKENLIVCMSITKILNTRNLLDFFLQFQSKTKPFPARTIISIMNYGV